MIGHGDETGDNKPRIVFVNFAIKGFNPVVY